MKSLLHHLGSTF